MEIRNEGKSTDKTGPYLRRPNILWAKVYRLTLSEVTLCRIGEVSINNDMYIELNTQRIAHTFHVAKG